MLTIKKISDKSRVTELDSVVIRILLEYHNENLSSDHHLKSLIEKLTTASEQFTKSINRIRAKSLLKEKDQIRDKMIQDLNHLLKGYLHNPLAELKDAAKEIYHIFRRYGLKMTQKGFSEKTALISSMLIDLKNSDLEKAISLLPGCKELLAELDLAQESFITSRLKYEETKAHEAIEKTASGQKMELLRFINNELIIYLRGMLLVNYDLYKQFAITLKEIIDENNSAVKRRYSK